MSTTGASDEACLERTRSAVLNVLLVVGAGIALSGLLLRWRDRWADVRATETARRAMLGGLFAVVVVSHLLRRVMGSRTALADPDRRASRFFRSHVLSAALGALAVPLGLAYGWTVRPMIETVAPFWVAALALGFLAIPRAVELDGLAISTPPPSEPKA